MDILIVFNESVPDERRLEVARFINQVMSAILKKEDFNVVFTDEMTDDPFTVPSNAIDLSKLKLFQLSVVTVEEEEKKVIEEEDSD